MPGELAGTLVLVDVEDEFMTAWRAHGPAVAHTRLKLPLPDGAQARPLEQIARDGIDDFDVAEREIYWLCLTKQSNSKFSNATLERKLRVRSTLRRVSMLNGLAGEV